MHFGCTTQLLVSLSQRKVLAAVIVTDTFFISAKSSCSVGGEADASTVFYLGLYFCLPVALIACVFELHCFGT